MKTKWTFAVVGCKHFHKIIEPQHEENQSEIICVERLDGLLRFHHRKAT